MIDKPGPASTQPAAPPTSAPPSPFELLLAFGKVSLSGFGGVLPWARRMIVEDRRWMTAEEFNEAFALSQFLPGPNIVNFSVVFGSRIAGPLGALLALIGLLGPPVIIVTLMAMLYARYGDLTVLQNALAGIAAAAAGLVIAVVAKMAAPLFKEFSPAPFFAVAAFVAIGLLRLPLLYVLAALSPPAIGIAFWRLRA
jgi:chromate transporter